MKIRNLTSQRKGFTAEELVGGRQFTISIEGNSICDIEGMYVPNLDTSIFEIVGVNVISTIETPEAVTECKIETPEEEVIGDEKSEGEIETPEVVSDKFICESCGAEFASSRALNMHIKKSHPEE